MDNIAFPKMTILTNIPVCLKLILKIILSGKHYKETWVESKEIIIIF